MPFHRRSSKRSLDISRQSTSSYNAESTSQKKIKSIADESHLSHINDSRLSSFGESLLSSESLALRLDRYCNDLASLHKDEYCDLADFEIQDGIENLEKLREMREEMQHKLSNFDFAGKTSVNFQGAAIAGAKVVVEERAATRSITKKLTDEVGIAEENLLYGALPYRGSESSVAKDIHEQRTESIIESFVDFQKQLKFKLSVLSHAIKKIEIVGKSKSAVLPDRISKRKHFQKNEILSSAKQNLLKIANRTPKKRNELNPLSFNKIIDEYALEVASEVTNRCFAKKRNVAPIPFDLSILDDVSLDKEN